MSRLDKKYIVRRLFAWVIDSYLVFIMLMLSFMLFDFMSRNVHIISELLGFPMKTVYETGQVYPGLLAKLWYDTGFYIILFVPVFIFILISKKTTNTWALGSIGKKIANIDIKKDVTTVAKVTSFIFFFAYYCCLFYVASNPTTSLHNTILWMIYLFDTVFIFFKGQLFHNYVVGTTCTTRYHSNGDWPVCIYLIVALLTLSLLLFAFVAFFIFE